MTPEALLMPRFKVTAPWPCMELEPFNIGQIVTLTLHETEGYIHIPIKHIPGSYMRKEFFETFPHLFQPLPWWSDRAVKEMPDFVKRVDMVDSHGKPVPDQYIKVKKHFASNSGDWRDDKYSVFAPDDSNVSSISYSGYLPATLEEYNEWKQSNK